MTNAMTDTRKGAMKFKNLGESRCIVVYGRRQKNSRSACTGKASSPNPLPKRTALIPIVIASALIGLGFAILAVRIFTK